MTTRPRGQSGASLMLVLFIIGFLAIVVPAVLGLVFSGAATTAAVRSDRAQQYAASSALDAAIQYGRSTKWVGRVGTTCPTTTLLVDDLLATVTCTYSTGPYDLDRTVSFVASVEGTQRASASVVYRDGTAGSGEPTVDVTTWNAKRP